MLHIHTMLFLHDSIDARHLAAAGSEEGRRWLDQLPALIEQSCRHWDLCRDAGHARHGYNAVVLPVRRGSEKLVLKLSWPPEGIGEEQRGLEAWRGRGTVRLLAADSNAGALLLERLDMDRSLRNVETIQAGRIAGALLRRLAIPAPAGFRDVRTLVAGTARALRSQQGRKDSPIPAGWLQVAIDIAEHLASHARTDLLVHADLHYGNILAGTREQWLAIDPRPVAGEPEQAVPELLWTRHDGDEGGEGIISLFQTIVDSANLDEGLTRHWVIVRCVDYWLWGLDHGLTHDPERCRQILRALIDR